MSYKIHITPTTACEHIKNNYKDDSVISPHDIQDQNNKIYFKTIINEKRTTITFYKNTGTIQTQPKNIDIEQFLDKFNKAQEKSKLNLDKFLKRNENTNPQRSSDIFTKKKDDKDERKDNKVTTTEIKLEETNKESIQIPTTATTTSTATTTFSTKTPAKTTSTTKADYVPTVFVDYSYKPPVFNNYNKKEEDNEKQPKDLSTIPNKRVYIAHEENKNAHDFILDILSKLNLEAVILQNDESRSLTIIEKELKKCDFGIVLITYEKKVYEKDVYAQSEEGTDLHREIKLPLLNVMLEMGLLIGHFGKKNTLIIEFLQHQYQYKLCNQMNIISGIVYHQSTDKESIIKEIKTIISNLNHHK